MLSILYTFILFNVKSYFRLDLPFEGRQKDISSRGSLENASVKHGGYRVPDTILKNTTKIIANHNDKITTDTCCRRVRRHCRDKHVPQRDGDRRLRQRLLRPRSPAVAAA